MECSREGMRASGLVGAAVVIVVRGPRRTLLYFSLLFELTTGRIHRLRLTQEEEPFFFCCIFNFTIPGALVVGGSVHTATSALPAGVSEAVKSKAFLSTLYGNDI